MWKAGIDVDAPVIKHTGGGIVEWAIMRKQVLLHLREREAVVTTLIDYYGTKDKHSFPGWEEAKGIAVSDRRHSPHHNNLWNTPRTMTQSSHISL